MKRMLLATLVAGAVAAGVLTPVLLLADVASCSVTVGSYADAIINPPAGEDTEFFVSTGGVPNIMFVLDTSASMRRLPPDGASLGWGSFERAASSTAGSGYGCSNPFAARLTFHSPCGTTQLEGRKFNPNALSGLPGPDFATDARDASGRYCPHMTAGNQPPATNRPGFDPDFFDRGGSMPWFFQANRVYHDTVLDPDASADGWEDWSTSPTSHATTGDFCSQWSGTPEKRASCDTCMRDQGYFFDGTYYAHQGMACGSTADCQARNAGTCIRDDTGLEYAGAEDGLAHCRVPHVWFSGNFLNFYPPKFVVARKVMKDVLLSVRKVRLGLTVFDSNGDGGKLLWALNPPCSMLGSPSNFDSNRGSLLTAINSKNSVTFSGPAPVAETLLEVGQLYSSRALPWFDSSFQDSSFQDNVASSNTKSVCFSCQASAVLLISGGNPWRDGKIPGTSFAPGPMTLATATVKGSYAGMAGYNITGVSAADCPVCETEAEAADTAIPAGTCRGNQASGACDDAGNPIPAYLPKVAWYLRNLDFRDDAERGADGIALAGKQNVTTYTIGLGTRGNASAVLQHAAEAGGGLYNGGSGSDVTDAKALRDAIMRVFEDVNTRSTSFGAASLSTLQIASSQGVLIPRFEPSRNAHWDGHLFAFDLFSEFAGGCQPRDPSASGPANGDYDCDGKCASVFLKDADGHFIQEDGTGAFRKNLNRGLAACGSGSRCDPSDCSGPDLNALATPFWDAGSKLAPVKTTVDPVSGIASERPNPDFSTDLEWSRRAIYTVVDSNGDGAFTSADNLVDLRDAYPAAMSRYLNIRGSGFCSKLSARLNARGNPIATTIDAEIATGDYTACSKAILDYARGADLFNERRCSGYPNTYCTRKYQLGDIFHSSPIEVWPPLPSDGFSCPRGLHPQCLPSLFSNSIPNPAQVAGNASAYDDYAKSARYKSRRKFALVGANDGMLHAFRIERTDARAGEEIWAFIPPDLLPKLRLLLDNVHHFYVDATPMVRDVWLDGISNGLQSGTHGANGVREGREFHTVAIVGERRGGTRYFALDVTDASDDLEARPKFLWLYPQPTDPRSLEFGETYVEFVPKPPPIGPVRIDEGPAPCEGNAQQFQDGSGATRCFSERWIALLSGGFDPQYTRGRGVYMVDVATGETIWDFTQTRGPASACDATKDPRCFLHYPIAATPGMMMWGKEANFLSAAAVDGYFDTATVGDTGGQLWVLRFSDPGRGWTPGGSTKVTNWFGARAFQHGKATSTPGCALGFCDSQPFFYITSNLPLAANGLYRTLAGTGDRFNVLDPVGGTCGPNNIRACLIKGCTVTIDDGAGGAGAAFGVEPLLGTQTYRAEHPAFCSAVQPSAFVYAQSDGSGGSCTSVVTRIDGLRISCPSTRTCSSAAESTTKRASVVCSSGSCDPAASNDFGIPIDLKGNADKRNWFFSVQVFERSGARTIFRTLEEAIAYDGARLGEGDLKNVNDYDVDPVPANLASPEGRGWSYFFDHGRPSTRSAGRLRIAGVDHDIYRTDERTASVSQVEYGCTFWNTMQTGLPVGSTDSTTGCPVNSPCKAGRAQVSYLYGANPGSGGLCLKVDGELARSQKNETLVPPHIGKLVAYVGETQVSFGLTSVRVPQGGANVQLGEAQDLASPVQWLPVDRESHACRHAPKTAPPDPAVCR